MLLERFAFPSDHDKYMLKPIFAFPRYNFKTRVLSFQLTKYMRRIVSVICTFTCLRVLYSTISLSQSTVTPANIALVKRSSNFVGSSASNSIFLRWMQAWVYALGKSPHIIAGVISTFF